MFARRFPRFGSPDAIGGLIILAVSGCAAFGGRVFAADQPQWGERFTRNMVSAEKDLPARFNPENGENVLWSADLGADNYSSPIIAGGRVYIGANNARPRDPRIQGDRAVLLSLDERTGDLQWQLAVPRLSDDPYMDWPRIGMCSPPTVDGDRLYTVTNRFEVVCLDVDGQSDGNDGPYQDEGRHMAPPGEPPLEATEKDADIIWLFDMPKEVGSYPHDGAHASILMDGRFLYVNTGNGVDNTHRKIRAPEAPSLIVLDKLTGRLVAQDGERIGPRIFHATWSSPALGEIGGNRIVFFAGGDGVLYGFEALPQDLPEGPVRTLKRVWRFDCDPQAPKEEVHQYIGNRRVSPSNIKSMPVFHNGRIYVTVGGDIWWGKREAWLQCIDAREEEDATETGLLWSYPLQEHCCSTPSIADGLAFVADCGRTVHCLDAETGRPYWTHVMRGDAYGSTLVADGKVYVGSRRGDFYVFAADKEKRILAEIDLGGPTASTPTAANGVLYVATLTRLFAVREKTGGDAANR